MHEKEEFLFDDSETSDVEGKLIYVGSMTPLILTLTSIDNPFIQLSGDVDELASGIVQIMADDCGTAIRTMVKWINWATDSYEFLPSDTKISFPDMDATKVRDEVPEISYVLDHAVQFFDDRRTMEQPDFMRKMHEIWHDVDEEHQSALMFTVLMAAANTIHSAAHKVGPDKMRQTVQAINKVRESKSPEDLFE